MLADKVVWGVFILQCKHSLECHICTSLNFLCVQMVLDLTGLALYDSILLLDDSYSMTAAEG